MYGKSYDLAKRSKSGYPCQTCLKRWISACGYWHENKHVWFSLYARTLHVHFEQFYLASAFGRLQGPSPVASAKESPRTCFFTCLRLSWADCSLCATSAYAALDKNHTSRRVLLIVVLALDSGVFPPRRPQLWINQRRTGVCFVTAHRFARCIRNNVRFSVVPGSGSDNVPSFLFAVCPGCQNLAL